MLCLENVIVLAWYACNDTAMLSQTFFIGEDYQNVIETLDFFIGEDYQMVIEMLD